MKYQLLLQFPLDENFDFDALIGLETELRFRLGNAHVVDGHTIGTDAVNILVNTDDPDIAFQKAITLLAGPLAATLKAAYRETNSDQYHWLHPANNEDDFRPA